MYSTELGDGIKTGRRAGRVVNLLTRVVGRGLSSGEMEVLKEFHDNMNYSDRLSDSDILIDYFYFLLGEGSHPSGMSRPKMPLDAKQRLIECIQTAIAWGVISIGNDKDSLIKKLQRHAGITKKGNQRPPEVSIEQPKRSVRPERDESAKSEPLPEKVRSEHDKKISIDWLRGEYEFLQKKRAQGRELDDYEKGLEDQYKKLMKNEPAKSKL